jgi:hypothetical protein
MTYHRLTRLRRFISIHSSQLRRRHTIRAPWHRLPVDHRTTRRRGWTTRGCWRRRSHRALRGTTTQWCRMLSRRQAHRRGLRSRSQPAIALELSQLMAADLQLDNERRAIACSDLAILARGAAASGRDARFVVMSREYLGRSGAAHGSTHSHLSSRGSATNAARTRRAGHEDSVV